ncbi:hypothetical protein GF358_04655 [Candidatus Woesearchaeota archaeon]|nr:hypothetical protein [Candidatus Woesearchaeota archaeon]
MVVRKMGYTEQRDEDKNTLNFVIDEILKEITSDLLPKLPKIADMAEIQEKYIPNKYEIELNVNKVKPHQRFNTARITARISKKSSDKGYDHFEEYWQEAKTKIADNSTPIELRALHVTEVFRNLAEYYGNDLQNPEIKQIGKSLQEIVKRLLGFSKKHDDKQITVLDTSKIGILPEELTNKKAIYVLNLYKNLINDPKIISMLVNHEVQGKFKQTPFIIKTEARVCYD